VSRPDGLKEALIETGAHRAQSDEFGWPQESAFGDPRKSNSATNWLTRAFGNVSTISLCYDGSAEAGATDILHSIQPISEG